MEGVGGSRPLGSTSSDLGPWQLGGFVAGEGSFVASTLPTTYADGTPRRKFVFQVRVATRDRTMLDRLRAYLRYGSIRDCARGNERWQPSSVFTIRSHGAHRAATIPFAERFLLPCAKRIQFERWRDDLYAHEERHPNRFGKGASVCGVVGCEKPVRGRGLCRNHYYLATGY